MSEYVYLMEGAEKQFGPLMANHDPEDGLAMVYSIDSIYEGPAGSLDEMIKALRDAANWLEWRRACERRNDGERD